MKKPENLQGIEWVNCENMLQALAPDLWVQHKKEMQNDTDKPGIYEEISRLKGFAIEMVRYASSNNPADRRAHKWETDEELINPKTEKAFTFEDLSVTRNECIGSTIGIEGREEQVARVTIELYRKLHQD